MKSSVTRWFGKAVDIAFPFFVVILFINMMRDGAWWWVFGAIVGGTALVIFMEHGIDWLYNRRKCPSKWMDMYPCQLRRNHPGDHKHTAYSDARTFHWDEVQ